MDADVVVVGGGLAGLTAARDLAAAGLSPVVLEARDRVGGRTLNQDIGNGKVVELGGQWIGPTQDRVAKLAAELGVETFPTYDDGERVVFVDERRLQYKGDYPTRINPVVLADFGQALVRVERLAKRVPLEKPWTAPKAKEWDGQTFESWVRRNTRTRRARQFFQVTVQGVFSTELCNLSLLHFLFYAHSGGSVQKLIGVKDCAQQDRFVGGSQLLAIEMARGLGDSVRLRTPVRRIRQTDGGVTVEGDGTSVSGGSVVVAVPPTLAGRIDYDPPLPFVRDQLHQRMPHGTVIKANVIYEQPFWRREGLSGQAFDLEMPFSTVFDNSPPDGSPGALVGFFEAEQAIRYGQMTVEDRRKTAVECLVRYFGRKAASPEAYYELDWSAEEWTRGCYGGHMPPGAWTQFGPALREPVGRIHWAGTETAIRWCGYMDGAIESGHRAANEVISALA
ncbi:MAG: FAD-dependent oxidoreductase [Actinomycetota bacterium]|nr:FAD-dependent oxidoreductase [Actinomycetota bacterium]